MAKKRPGTAAKLRRGPVTVEKLATYEKKLQGLVGAIEAQRLAMEDADIATVIVDGVTKPKRSFDQFALFATNLEVAIVRKKKAKEAQRESMN